MTHRLGQIYWVLAFAATGLFALAVWMPLKQGRQSHLLSKHHPSFAKLLNRDQVRPLVHRADNSAVAGPKKHHDGEQSLASVEPPKAKLSVASSFGERAQKDTSVGARRSLMDEQMALPKVAGPPIERSQPPVRDAERQPMPRRHDHTRLVQHVKTQKKGSINGWPQAEELHSRLDALSTDHFSADIQSWASRVRHSLDELTKAKLSDYAASTATLESLTRLASHSVLSQSELKDSRRTHIRRANFALQRRISVWKEILERERKSATVLPTIEAGANEVLSQLGQVNARFATDELRKSWRSFLGLDELEQLCGGDLVLNVRARRTVSRKFLRRIQSPSLREQQKQYLKRLAVETLAEQMKTWADEPIRHQVLLRRLERFELHNDGLSAKHLARSLAAVKWSLSDAQELNKAIDTHYRNSNLRIAISSSLINRLLPDPQVEKREVVDEILGAEVFSRSRILNRLRLKLLPDRRRWRLSLEAEGEVDSESSSTKGPATFYNEGVSRYRARKLVLVDRRGVRLARARAQANANSTLTDVETDFDSVPLLNLFARSIAINQHDSSQDDAQWEVEQRVADMASSRLDKAVASHVGKATQEFRRKVILPLQRLELNPRTTDMQTTSQRIIARYRIAGIHQLAANTPRPLAPGDSWLSIQIHESALNNVFEQLKLGEKEMNLSQLYDKIAIAFARKYKAPKELATDVRIRFTKHNGVRVTCDHGRVTLDLKFAELVYGRARIKNFGVRAFFKPVAVGLKAQLIRADHIEISGRLRLGQKLMLRPIFAKALPVARAIDLIDPKLSTNSKIKDLGITQFKIAHGWIGLAMARGRAVRISLKD